MNTEGSRQQHMAEEKRHNVCAERLVQELGAASQSQKAWKELLQLRKSLTRLKPNLEARTCLQGRHG